MNAALHPPPFPPVTRDMTRDEFFAWAERQEGRHEFDGRRPVAMTGGSNDHGRISRNLNVELFLRLRGTGCEPMPSDGGGVATTGNRVRYPDCTVTCSPIPGRARLVPDPVAVFEVLSPGSFRRDGTVKLREYLAVPTIRHCVLIEQEGVGVVHHARHGDGWLTTPLLAGDTLVLDAIGVELPVAALYAGVTLETAEAPSGA